MAPTGIGGLVLHPQVPIKSTRYGGTGVESDSLFQPQEFPFRLEAGTINLFGVFALGETLAHLKTVTDAGILSREMALFTALRDGLSELNGVELYCAKNLENHLPLLSCNIGGIDSADVAVILDGDFDIAVRAGLQCAPLVHQQLNTSPSGTVRLSLGVNNVIEDIQAVVSAIWQIATRAP
jgi:selenocysteine lyase/cysteine desulfurase